MGTCREREDRLSKDADECAETLEVEADCLLGLGRKRRHDGEYPFTTERRLREKTQAGRDAFMAVDEPIADVAMEARLLDAVIRAARLKPQEAEVIMLQRSGHGRAQIARAMGVGGATVTRLGESAVRKMRAVADERESESVLDEGGDLVVYWEGVNRPLYAPPRCCGEGRERCRSTALCDQRWYLFADPVPDHARV